MSEPARSAPRTAAALAARHRDTQAALGRVDDIIARLRREKTPVSVAAVARRAGVSRTFLYTNVEAKTAVAKAIRESGDQRSRLIAEADDSREATWRERALNAEDALKHILDAGTDILLTDHGMGQMDGAQLIRELRARKSTIPIIMVSGNPAAREEALLAGATEFLDKNAGIKALEAGVRSLIPPSDTAST